MLAVAREISLDRLVLGGSSMGATTALYAAIQAVIKICKRLFLGTKSHQQITLSVQLIRQIARLVPTTPLNNCYRMQ